MKLIPYIMFNGNAEEAIGFYQKALSASEAYIMRYSEAEGMTIPEGYENNIMHAELRFGNDNILYFSDNWPGETSDITKGISFNLAMDSEETLNALYKALAEGGKETQPPKQEFWGAIFGSCDDKYGIHWSFNYELPRES